MVQGVEKSRQGRGDEVVREGARLEGGRGGHGGYG